jgi:hypothetical protein
MTVQLQKTIPALPTALPEGRYRLSDQGLVMPAEQAAMSWELGAYEFDLYKPWRRAAAQLLLAAGPEELAAAARIEAKQHGANFRQVVGRASWSTWACNWVTRCGTCRCGRRTGPVSRAPSATL